MVKYCVWCSPNPSQPDPPLWSVMHNFAGEKIAKQHHKDVTACSTTTLMVKPAGRIYRLYSNFVCPSQIGKPTWKPTSPHLIMVVITVSLILHHLFSNMILHELLKLLNEVMGSFVASSINEQRLGLFVSEKPCAVHAVHHQTWVDLYWEVLHCNTETNSLNFTKTWYASRYLHEWKQWPRSRKMIYCNL